ncbi:2Fe-2S iron-sulfur cluster-binding protein [Parasphingorhabdus sp. DH2-15]|jgi:ferredoxin|uniref:2Fe-2S iron-sulfur cluster-binding protein n=1 Tax=Parasphingorhabdus sp. DH2-15 TaxID=3444112 RepID=UPI003F6844F4
MSDELQVIFVSEDGETEQKVSASIGERLLDVGQAAGQPLEGTCEGQMACSTCHVIFSREDFARLPEPVEMEEDMLDLATAVTPTSRLACQIFLTKDMDGLKAHIPSEVRDMTGI